MRRAEKSPDASVDSTRYQVLAALESLESGSCFDMLIGTIVSPSSWLSLGPGAGVYEKEQHKKMGQGNRKDNRERKTPHSFSPERSVTRRQKEVF